MVLVFWLPRKRCGDNLHAVSETQPNKINSQIYPNNMPSNALIHDDLQQGRPARPAFWWFKTWGLPVLMRVHKPGKPEPTSTRAINRAGPKISLLKSPTGERAWWFETFSCTACLPCLWLLFDSNKWSGSWLPHCTMRACGESLPRFQWVTAGLGGSVTCRFQAQPESMVIRCY